MCNAASRSSMPTRDDRTQTDLPAQSGGTPVDSPEPTHITGRLKKLQNLVQTKRGHQSGPGKGKSTSEVNDHLADVVSNNNPVLTCIGLGKRTEKEPSSPQQQRQQQATGLHGDTEEEDVWSPKCESLLWGPFDCPQSWTLYHTCHQPQHGPWAGGGTLSLPRTSEWDRFESLIQELDGKLLDLSPPQMIRSITDLHLSQNPDTDKQKEDAEKMEVVHGRSFPKGHRRSRNSLESLYSLNSGQSSSSGVTSGSGCSSNRDSLRMEDDQLCMRPSCGRARVHTDYVPSPYDTESLKLKVGDIIDIITKPAMGIWTGTLNGRKGNFKFIYVDVLTEERSETHEKTQIHKVRHKSTIWEVLKRLRLEEYSSCLQLSGYQTVDDLLRLREHHLMELNVTDPEHRQRLLAAVNSLQQLCSDSQLENEANREAETSRENMKADMNNCPRDSGCHMPPDSPDSSSEDTHLPFTSEHLSAGRTAS
ncbi:SAM domain-containing protein SAMSN-1-like [Embiotoca jacksoni]|uniref:SAM domain-containing protein SAMSN-1-like n=1 Tax=Embiotoca jacksoni TaxID=100190 RepID=UPI0037048328